MQNINHKETKTDRYEIDVIIVTKNRYKEMYKAFRSVCRNSLKPINIFVIDGSEPFNEKTKLKVSRLAHKARVNLVYIRDPRKGIGYSRGEGLLMAKSPYFVYLDDDEIAPSFWLKNIVSAFKNKKGLDVVCGPKIPRHKSNYWNKVWTSMLEEEFYYQGKAVGVITPDNSAYRTSFIRKREINYDPRLKYTCDDRAFSVLLAKNHANMYFDKNVWVKHDYRTSLGGFIKQWFYYGAGKFIYHKLYFGGGYLWNADRWRKTAQNFKSTFPYKGSLKNIEVLPGLILLNVAYLMGYLYAFVFARPK